MPVTTPMAKLIRNNLPKNLVALQILLVVGADPGGLQAGDQEGQADRDGDEEEVVDGGDTELPSGNV